MNTSTNCSSQLNIRQFHDYYPSQWIYLINIGAILLILPLLDRLVYPLLCPWVPSMFNRIRAGLIFSIFSIICATIVEVVRYTTLYSQDTVVQVNVFRYEQMVSVSIPVGVMAPQYFFQAVAECLAIPTCESLSLNYMYSTDLLQTCIHMQLNPLVVLLQFS